MVLYPNEVKETRNVGTEGIRRDGVDLTRRPEFRIWKTPNTDTGVRGGGGGVTEKVLFRLKTEEFSRRGVIDFLVRSWSRISDSGKVHGARKVKVGTSGNEVGSVDQGDGAHGRDEDRTGKSGKTVDH